MGWGGDRNAKVEEKEIYRRKLVLQNWIKNWRGGGGEGEVDVGF